MWCGNMKLHSGQGISDGNTDCLLCDLKFKIVQNIFSTQTISVVQLGSFATSTDLLIFDYVMLTLINVFVVGLVGNQDHRLMVIP